METPWELEVSEGEGEARRLALGPGELRVGRTQDMDLVLGGAGVSRHHCTLHVGLEGVRVENLSSTRAGTTLNGARLEALAALAPGDRVGVGDALLVLRGGPAPAPTREKPTREKPAREKPAREGPGRESQAREEPAREEPACEEPADEEERGGEGRRGRADAFLERKRAERRFRRAAYALCGVVALGLAGWVVSGQLQRSSAPESAASRGGGSPAASPRPQTSASGAGAGAGSADADAAWASLRSAPLDGVAPGLLAFAAAFPDDRRAEDARFYAERLQGGARGGGGRVLEAAVGAMLQEARRLVEAREPARAQAVLELVAALLPGSPQARAAALEKAKLAEVAKEAFAELSARAREMAASLSPVQAIVTVLEASPRLRGLGVDAELYALVADLEQEAGRAAARRAAPGFQRSGRAFTVEQELVNASLRFDFARARALGEELLLLGLDEEERLRAHWLRQQVRGLEQLYQQMLAAAKGPPERRPECTVRGGLRVRLVGSDGPQVTLATIAAPGERAGELTWPWARMAPSQLQELLAKVGEDDLQLSLAKAFHAFRTGLEERGMEVLLPWATRRQSRGEAMSCYSLAAGVPLPEGGFVVFEGRLISPAERDRIQQERIEARATAKALAEAAREEQGRQKLLLLLKRVLALLDEGHYEAGRAALTKLVERHGAVEGVGDVARRRLEGSLLRRRDLRLSKGLGRNGPPKNRLDIYFLGDGYLLDDERQLQFDRHADSAAKFCQLQDFFKEYDQYINYWAVNLWSKVEGLSKDGAARETALGSEVNGGVHTVGDRARVFALLDQQFAGEHDRLAVVLGNDYATVATGGGGTVAVCKTMLEATPHELGHAFGGLGDEYDKEPTPNPPPPQAWTGAPRQVAPNVLAAATRDAALKAASWEAWLDPTGEKNWTKRPIGAFEGANRQPRGYWRPQQSCVMRDVGSPFCAVCMETMVRALYRVVRPIDQVWPAEPELTAGREPITFRVLVLKPQSHPVFVHWRRKRLEWKPPTPNPQSPADDDATRERGPLPPQDAGPTQADVSGKLQVIEGRFVHYIRLTPRDLPPGRYEISAECWDPTDWVRDAHRPELTQTQRWTLTIPPR
ncbi:MAG: M64 family metallopeptidase [Planctomycetota bacterium]